MKVQLSRYDETALYPWMVYTTDGSDTGLIPAVQGIVERQIEDWIMEFLNPKSTAAPDWMEEYGNLYDAFEKGRDLGQREMKARIFKRLRARLESLGVQA